MKKAKVLSAIPAIFLAFVSPAVAQVTLKKISDCPISAAGIHTPYTFPEITDTPSPAGFSPVYISHTGRHGSRYNTNEKELQYISRTLAECDKQGLLNERGKELRRQFEVLYDASRDKFGALSSRGAMEHQQIASRMHNRYPEVFHNRKSVTAASSTSIRCVLSMANFGTSLVRSDNAIAIDYAANDETKKYLMKNTGIGDIEKKRREIVSPLKKEMFNPDRFFNAICNDQSALRKIIDDRHHFCKDLYVAGGIEHCIDLDSQIDLYSFFTDKELYTLAKLDCYDFYGDHADSREFGKKRVAMADELVKDIIFKADRALEPDSPYAADLRFTHDWVVSPLFAMVGVDGMDKRLPFTSVDKYWMTSDYIPMAANIQFIFYSDGNSRNTLVKVLLNEKETRIPALKPVSGPYYRWSDLRAWLEKRIHQFCD